MAGNSLIFLTWNEITGTKALFDQVPLHLFSEVLAVDGGSVDGTREFFAEKGVKIVDQAKPGRGEAMRTGAKAATGDVVLFFSPDGNEDPADIEKILKKIEEGYDLVIASRFMKESRNEEDGKLFPCRLWANKTYTWLANRLFNKSGRFVTDTINGFRAMKREAFLSLGLSEQRFPIEYQMSIRCMKKGLKIAEIPTREEDRLGGESKALSIPVGLGHLKVLLQEITRN